MTAIQECARVVAQPKVAIAEAKARTGARAIGCFPMYVPHELVDAAGMLPVDIYGGSGEMTVARSVLQSIVCYPVRSAFEGLLTGALDELDGAIFGTVCTGATAGSDLWHDSKALPFHHQLVIPHRARGDANVAQFRRQIERLRRALEGFAGKPIPDEAITTSIRRYNRGRVLLRRLAEISADSPGDLHPRDFAVVRAAGSFMPRVDFVALLAALCEQLSATRRPGGEGVRLVLAGNLCDIPHFDIIETIHAAGGTVAADDTALGERSWVLAAEDGDPLDALARRYFDSTPCPTRYDETLDPHLDHLMTLRARARAQGIVFLRPLYCDPAGLEYPLLAERLAGASVPVLVLDLDGRESASGQIETRLQAFVEMLGR